MYRYKKDKTEGPNRTARVKLRIVGSCYHFNSAPLGNYWKVFK